MDEQTDFFHPRENSRLFGHDDVETLLDAISAGRSIIRYSLQAQRESAALLSLIGWHDISSNLKRRTGYSARQNRQQVSICRKNISYSDRLQPADTHRLSLGASKEPRNR